MGGGPLRCLTLLAFLAGCSERADPGDDTAADFSTITDLAIASDGTVRDGAAQSQLDLSIADEQTALPDASVAPDFAIALDQSSPADLALLPDLAPARSQARRRDLRDRGNHQ